MSPERQIGLLASLVFGFVVGSFVGLCAYRIPRGGAIVFDFSRCDGCGKPLPWRHKLPLLGYLIQKGHSRCCGNKISKKYAMTEASIGIFFALLYWRGADNMQLLSEATLVALLAVGALIDMERRLIPDKVTFPGIVLGLLLNGLLHRDGFIAAGFGILVCGGFLFLGSKLGEMLTHNSGALGGGDIKFAAMIGAFLGWQQGFLAIMLAVGLGSLYGLVKLIAYPDFRTHRLLPFGPFLALGALSSLIWGPGLLGWYFTTFGVMGQ